MGFSINIITIKVWWSILNQRVTQAAWKENAEFSQQESNVAHHMYDLQFTNPFIPVFSARSRPWDKLAGRGSPVIQTLREAGRGRSPKLFFRPFGPQFGLKMRGWPVPRAPPLDVPLVLMCALYSCICRLKAVNQAPVEPQVKEFWPTFSTRSLIKRAVLEGARVEAVLLSEAMRRLSWIEWTEPRK